MLAVSLWLQQCDAQEADSAGSHEAERDPVDYPTGSCRGHEPAAGYLRHDVHAPQLNDQLLMRRSRVADARTGM